MDNENKIVYLDYNATAPLKKEALDRMVDIYTNQVMPTPVHTNMVRPPNKSCPAAAPL